MTNAYGVPEWATWVPELKETGKARAFAMRRVVALLTAVTLLTAASATAVALLKDDGPPHPEAWDPRVQELVDFVETERGLSFVEPVYVDFLGDADFKAQVRADTAARTSASAETVVATAEVFGALGLIEGKVHAGELAKPSADGGYYSYDDERIWVRGTELTPAVESTVVRELTHALQDQRFDLDKRLDKVMGGPDATAALTALVAVDPDRVEAGWRLGLDKKERASIVAVEASQATLGAAVPAVLQTHASAPYVLADAALALARQTGGDKAVDQLFRTPPTTDEHELDPWTHVADHAVPIGTSRPELARREKELGHGTFGAVSWLVVLAARIPPAQALTAADGWGGDAYVAFTRGQASCVRMHYRGDTGRDIREMRIALTDWVAAAPAGSARVQRSGALLTFESCAAGSARVPATTGPQDAIALAVSRTSLSATLADRGWSPTRARCGANILVRALTPEQLMRKLDGPKVKQLTASCEA